MTATLRPSGVRHTMLLEAAAAKRADERRRHDGADRVPRYQRGALVSSPLLTAMFALMIVIAWLAGVEPWMIGIGAVLAVIGYLLERRRDE